MGLSELGHLVVFVCQNGRIFATFFLSLYHDITYLLLLLLSLLLLSSLLLVLLLSLSSISIATFKKKEETRGHPQHISIDIPTIPYSSMTHISIPFLPIIFHGESFSRFKYYLIILPSNPYRNGIYSSHEIH